MNSPQPPPEENSKTTASGHPFLHEVAGVLLLGLTGWAGWAWVGEGGDLSAPRILTGFALAFPVVLAGLAFARPERLFMNLAFSLGLSASVFLAYAAFLMGNFPLIGPSLPGLVVVLSCLVFAFIASYWKKTELAAVFPMLTLLSLCVRDRAALMESLGFAALGAIPMASLAGAFLLFLLARRRLPLWISFLYSHLFCLLVLFLDFGRPVSPVAPETFFFFLLLSQAVTALVAMAPAGDDFLSGKAKGLGLLIGLNCALFLVTAHLLLSRGAPGLFLPLYGGCAVLWFALGLAAASRSGNGRGFERVFLVCAVAALAGAVFFSPSNSVVGLMLAAVALVCAAVSPLFNYSRDFLYFAAAALAVLSLSLGLGTPGEASAWLGWLRLDSEWLAGIVQAVLLFSTAVLSEKRWERGGRASAAARGLGLAVLASFGVSMLLVMRALGEWGGDPVLPLMLAAMGLSVTGLALVFNSPVASSSSMVLFLASHLAVHLYYWQGLLQPGSFGPSLLVGAASLAGCAGWETFLGRVRRGGWDEWDHYLVSALPSLSAAAVALAPFLQTGHAAPLFMPCAAAAGLALLLFGRLGRFSGMVLSGWTAMVAAVCVPIVLNFQAPNPGAAPVFGMWVLTGALIAAGQRLFVSHDLGHARARSALLFSGFFLSLAMAAALAMASFSWCSAEMTPVGWMASAAVVAYFGALLGDLGWSAAAVLLAVASLVSAYPVRDTFLASVSGGRFALFALVFFLSVLAGTRRYFAGHRGEGRHA